MADKQEQLEMAQASAPLNALGSAYGELASMVMKTVMGLTDNNPLLAHAVAASVEARLRALNHYGLVTSIINDTERSPAPEGKP